MNNFYNPKQNQLLKSLFKNKMTFIANILHSLMLLLIITLVLPHIQTVSLLYPVSFGVVRSSAINVNLRTYMKNIGYPNIDDNGNNIGYNIVSLDGYQTSTTLSSINNDLTPFSTWINVYPRVLANAKSLYGKTSSDIQKYIKQQFNNRASKILFNAFSFQRPISQKNASALQQAQKISDFVSSSNFDGVSIDFQDFNSVLDRTASQWLTTLLKNIRKNIGKNKIIVLQIHPTFINNMAIFKNPLINSYVDLFVIKYYNLLQENYNTFQALFVKSKTFNLTSIWEIQQSKQIKMDICKTIIAKPSYSAGTWTKDAFLASNTLGGFFDQARTRYSWYGGYANLDIGGDPESNFQLVVLNSLRNYCYRSETCFCW